MYAAEMDRNDENTSFQDSPSVLSRPDASPDLIARVPGLLVTAELGFT